MARIKMIHEVKDSVFKNQIKVFRLKLSNLPLLMCFIVSANILLSGCQGPQERWPEIKPSSDTSTKIPPLVTLPPWTPPKTDTSSGYPRAWMPTSSERSWSAIVVHHSATETGNMALFDKEHKNNGWDGVGYDFVIGNGSDSGDGQIEVTYRWKDQVTGAHCKTPDNWANENGIGICLVGNFNDRQPTQKQIQSLVSLTNFLQKRYGIPQSMIYGHGTTPGAHATDCPGRLFPMSKFKSMLSY
jgi:N-acetylmuramoyl-L-alanine amidase